jgi:hypothetical protein
MIITKKALPRRALLQGVGVSLALPLLDAMVPAMTALASTPAKVTQRLGYIYVPMGSNQAQWTPAETGKLSRLSPTLHSLSPFIDQVTVISNLENKPGYSTGNHATSNSSYLSCAKAKLTEGTDYELGTTVDQIAARQIGKDTPLPSLELATDLLTNTGNCDNGLACVYMTNMAWSTPTTPLPAEGNPRVVFERLFGNGGSMADRMAELRRNSSILDGVNDEIARLQNKLGSGDRSKVEQYMDTIREVERRVQQAEQRSEEKPLPELERPLGVPASYGDHVKLLFDLQALAFQGDITRVVTFQMARESSTRTYPEIGVPEAHHPTSHHGGDPEKLAKLAMINAYHVSLFAYFLEKLKSTPDGDGTLLDHTLYLYGSGMGDPDRHDHTKLPIVVAGGGAGKMKGARHVKYDEATPLANLHVTLLDKVGVHLDSFGDSTGRIEELGEPLSL